MAENTMNVIIAKNQADLNKIPLTGTTKKAWKKKWVRKDLISGTEAISIFFTFDGKDIKNLGLPSQEVTFLDNVSFSVSGKSYSVTNTIMGNSLVEVIPLVNVDAHKQATRSDSVILVMNSLTEVAKTSNKLLNLGAKSIRICCLSNSDKYLMLIQEPSLFMLESWRDEGVVIYLNESKHNMWVCSGMQHPWSSWIHSKPVLDKSTIYLVDQTGWASIKEEMFSDIYDFVEIVMPNHKTSTLEVSKEAVKFKVPLRFSSRKKKENAEIWMVTDDEQDRLEGLLTVLSDSDLNNLQIATVMDSEENTIFVIRELIAGRTRGFIDFGTAYKTYGGINSLFIPLGKTIEPPIRRDLLIDAFKVTNRSLTFVVENNNKMSVVSVKDQDFGPFHNIISYVIQCHISQLRGVLERSIFEDPSITDYVKVPAITNDDIKDREVKSSKSTRIKIKDVTPNEGDVEVGEVEVVEQTNPVESKEEEEVNKFTFVENPDTSMEEKLEKNAVDNMENYKIWVELSNIKMSLGNVPEAIGCLEHAIWVCADKTQNEALWNTYNAMSTMIISNKDKYAESIDILGVNLRSDIIKFCDKGRKKALSASDIVRQLPSLIEKLRSSEKFMSKKSRWLLWERILNVSNDTVELAQQRTSIIADLSMRGIEDTDTFSFIPKHLKTRDVKKEDGGPISNWIGTLDPFLNQISDKFIRTELKAQIGVSAELLGNKALATDVLNEIKNIGKLQKGQGALALAGTALMAARIGSKDVESIFKLSLTQLNDMPDNSDKDYTFAPLLEYLQEASLGTIELEFVNSLIEIMNNQSVKRRSVQLFHCSRILTNMNLGSLVVKMALDLITNQTIYREGYYLDHAIRAMVIGQSGRTIPTEIATEIFDRISTTEKFLDTYAMRSLDACVDSLGDAIIAKVNTAKETSKNIATSIILDSCYVRYYAQIKNQDKGIALLSDLVTSAFNLTNVDERLTVLTRLVFQISYFAPHAECTNLLKRIILDLKSAKMISRDQSSILIACAITSGKMGNQDSSYRILDSVIQNFETLLSSNDKSGQSVLFQTLCSVVDEIVHLGDVVRGGLLVKKALSYVDKWLLEKNNTNDHPYFIYQTKFRCALAMLSLESNESSIDVLKECINSVTNVKIFDGKDRCDLLIQVVQALALSNMDDAEKANILNSLLTIGYGKETSNSYNDTFRRDLLRKTLREVVQKDTYFRLNMQKMRAVEERLIRDRIFN